VSLIHSASSRTNFLANIDIVTDNASSSIFRDLSDEGSRNILVERVAQVVNTDCFDGVYFDIEPLTSGATWLPQMIQQIKELTDNKTVVVYGFSFLDDSRANGYGWSAAYLTSVCSAANYVELKMYNFNASTAAMYQAKVLDQIAKVVAAGLTQKILFNLPAYPASPMHNPSIENIANAGPLLQEYNTGLFCQAYLTQSDSADYLALFGR
jgi:hypothetical protein